VSTVFERAGDTAGRALADGVGEGLDRAERDAADTGRDAGRGFARRFRAATAGLGPNITSGITSGLAQGTVATRQFAARNASTFAGFARSGALAAGGIGAAATVVLAGVAFLLLRSGRVLGMQAGSTWRLALAGMQRRGQENTLQILVFGLAIMLLLILILVRTALIDEWQAQIPTGAPNHFVINIAPEDVVPMRGLLERNQVRSEPLFPMISGRIIKVNGENARDRDRYRGAWMRTGSRMGRGVAEAATSPGQSSCRRTIASSRASGGSPATTANRWSRWKWISPAATTCRSAIC